jgi:soluble lytic murein transglycosylase-like protein
MNELLAVSTGVDILLVLVLFWVAIRFLQRINTRNGLDFKAFISRLDQPDADPIAQLGLCLYQGMCWIAIAILIAGVAGCTNAQAASFSDRYDPEIQKAAHRYMPGVDWRLWKAQLYQESRLNPEATSPVGAEGIAQFMPRTWREVSAALGYDGVSARSAYHAILAGAYYMGQQRLQWRKADTEENRHSLAACNYNAGGGNCRRAQRLAGVYAWQTVLFDHLPAVTGRHAKETQTYVTRIWRWYAAML